jgi:hypothetical protein
VGAGGDRRGAGVPGEAGVARKTRDLTLEQAAQVDARIAKYADGRLTYTRFQAVVDGLVAAASPEATAAAERRASDEQVARPTRADPENDHGLRGFHIKAPVATVVVLDAALQRIADILEDLGDPTPSTNDGSRPC